MPSSISVAFQFSHPPEVVWRALTDPEALQHWFMRADFAPETGRQIRFDAEPVKGWRGWVEGRVTEAEPPQRLSFTWQGMPEHRATRVTYTLSAREGGTWLQARHEGFDRSHGWFNGWMLRTVLKNGWNRMFSVLLPPVLKAIEAGTLEQPRALGE